MRKPIAFLALALLALASCKPGNRGHTDGGAGMCPSACTMGCDSQGICHDCVPLQNVCAGDIVVICNPDGTYGATQKMCDVANNEHCMGGICSTPCDVAAASHNYIGCDYWPVTTVNAQLNPYFDFAVAVANPLMVGDVVTSGPATVTITIGNMMVAQKDVAPGDVQTIILPWVSEVSQNMQPETSALVPDGAYHLVSTLPV